MTTAHYCQIAIGALRSSVATPAWVSLAGVCTLGSVWHVSAHLGQSGRCLHTWVSLAGVSLYTWVSLAGVCTLVSVWQMYVHLGQCGSCLTVPCTWVSVAGVSLYTWVSVHCTFGQCGWCLYTTLGQSYSFLTVHLLGHAWQLSVRLGHSSSSSRQ